MNADEIGDDRNMLKLDPSRVVPHRTWSDPAPYDQRGPVGESSAASLWVAGLTSEGASESTGSTAGWLSGLVQEDCSQGPVAPRPLNHRRTWQSGWDDVDEESEGASAVVAPSTWLVGLVKEEKKVALNDIARLLFGGDKAEPVPAPVQRPKAETLEPQEASPDPFAPAPSLAVDPFAPTAVVAPPPPRPAPVAAPPSPTEEPKVRLPRGLDSTPVNDVAAAPIATPVAKAPRSEESESSPQLVRPVKPKLPKAEEPSRPVAEQKPDPSTFRKVPARARVSFYRSLAAMFDAGVPLFAIFEFLSREGESEALSQACRRMGQNLAEGVPLNIAARKEPALFDLKAVRMLEVGYKGGQLPEILHKLAEDEEHAWRLFQQLKSQLTYPLGIAMMTMLAVLLLPPLALNDLLKQIVSLTAEPPLLSRMLLQASAFIGSPWTILGACSVVAATLFYFRTPAGRRLIDRAEMALWFLPAVGPMWRHLIALRFLRVFSMVYQAGLPASSGLELAATATGSHLASRVAPLMKRALIEGGTLAESFETGGFLPKLAIDAVSAGENSGNVPVMLDKSAMILQTEVESRMDAVTKLIEPLVLSVLGVIVAVFVLGCLLPIVELTSTL